MRYLKTSIFPYTNSSTDNSQEARFPTELPVHSFLRIQGKNKTDHSPLRDCIYNCIANLLLHNSNDNS